MKNIVVLGSTGSIGTNTLDVISQFPDRFKVVGLTAGWNQDEICRQIKKFNPLIVAMADEESAIKLKKRCSGSKVSICSGVEGLIKVSTMVEADLVVSAIVGAAGLIPTISAIKAGKSVALANKETLVMAGEIVTEEVKKNKVSIYPVDSEHNAIFQSMMGHKRRDIKRIILTASGGAMIDKSLSKKKKAKPEEVMKHPNWQMGSKISIDSATMMNKGLEVIEAKWLFDILPENIDVVIHRQSVIHSMVEYIDGSIIAQMGVPDMRIPISFALNYPERLDLKMPSLDLMKYGSLTFESPDHDKFPCLSYAYKAIKIGGTMPAVLNAANEEAVKSFIQGKIGFLDISRYIKETMDSYTPTVSKTLEDVLVADAWARKEVLRRITLKKRFRNKEIEDSGKLNI